MKIKWYECPICGTKFNFWQELMGDESDETIAQRCNFKMDTYAKHKKIIDDKIYASIPLEKKEKFLEGMRNGKTVGESYENAGMTQEEGFVCMDYNILKRHYLSDKPVESRKANLSDVKDEDINSL